MIFVKDFGAIADGKTNSFDAFKSAVNAAIELDEPVEIILEAGEYRFYTGTENSGSIVIRNAHDITITGVKGKTFFTIENPMTGTFLIENCENIMIRNVIIDYDPLPFTQGTIVAIDVPNCTLDFEVDENYNRPDEDYFTSAESRLALCVDYNGDEKDYGDYWIIATRAVQVKNRIYRIDANEQFEGSSLYEGVNRFTFDSGIYKVGARLMYKANRYTQSAVSATNSKNIHVEDMTIYAGPAPGFALGMIDHVHINRATIEVKPGTDRLIGINADGVHAYGIRNGLILENSSISATGDDGVNLHAKHAIVYDVISDTEIVINTCGCSEYRIGDIIQIYDKQKREPRGIVTITSVSDDKYIKTITFDKPVEGIRSEKAMADDIFNLSACGQGSIFRNNNFGIQVGRSMLIGSYNILIENSTFINHRGWVINIHHDPNWGEGPQPYNVVVRGNIFNGPKRPRLPVINIHSIVPWAGGPVQGVRPVKNITIEGNTFYNPRNTLIDAGGVEGLYIYDNELIIDDVSSQIEPGSIINLDNANDVIIRNFSVGNPNGKSKQVVKIMDGVDSGIGGIDISGIASGDTDADEDIFDIRDERK
ncbi:MAG: hypothetical protein ACYCYI_06540 [Saccharofermentanales bacterium]